MKDRSEEEEDDDEYKGNGEKKNGASSSRERRWHSSVAYHQCETTGNSESKENQKHQKDNLQSSSVTPPLDLSSMISGVPKRDNLSNENTKNIPDSISLSSGRVSAGEQLDHSCEAKRIPQFGIKKPYSCSFNTIVNALKATTSNLKSPQTGCYEKSNNSCSIGKERVEENPRRRRSSSNLIEREDSTAENHQNDLSSESKAEKQQSTTSFLFNSNIVEELFTSITNLTSSGHGSLFLSPRKSFSDTLNFPSTSANSSGSNDFQVKGNSSSSSMDNNSCKQKETLNSGACDNVKVDSSNVKGEAGMGTASSDRLSEKPAPSSSFRMPQPMTPPQSTVSISISSTEAAHVLPNHHKNAISEDEVKPNSNEKGSNNNARKEKNLMEDFAERCQQSMNSKEVVKSSKSNDDNKHETNTNHNELAHLIMKGQTSRRQSMVQNQSSKKPIKLKNHASGANEFYDSLTTKLSSEPSRCNDHVCMGSIVSFQNSRPNGTSRSPEEVKRLAKDFFDQYYSSIKRLNSVSHTQRWEQVLKEIEASGTYQLTETELVYGAKLAWRNSVRCIGRIQWAKLQVFDARSVTTTSGMFEALCKHIKYATNKGNIRSAITVFPQRTDGRHDFRIWNPQLISYAGYRNSDGSITGDPANIEITEVCEKLGWKGNHTKWDILPLVLSANGHDPEYFEIPSGLIVQVPLSHPRLDWFLQMDLRWYALPAVSGMLFDCGGLEFTAAPFNGWYMGTEIGSRDLGDTQRYNIFEEVATRMGIDTKNPTTLWKDQAMVETNVAVLHSYQPKRHNLMGIGLADEQKAGVTIVDHHSASESFMKHYENEMRTRGGCPADWVWIVPPMSGSATPVFHQEMALYLLKPSYEYQEAAWKTHVWKKSAIRDGGGSSNSSKTRKSARRKFHFKEIARAVKFTSKLFGKALSKRVKATILYATETGKSEMYARRLGEIFAHSFNAQVYRMDEYDVINIEHEALILVVTSTFGNGDPPENGETFAHSLYTIKMNQGYTPGDEYGLNITTSKSFIKMNSQTDSVTNASEKKFERNDSLRGSQISDVMSDDNFGPLRNITFGVFALGSSAYPNFCAFGRYVDNLLGELGGERLMRLTCGDELSGQDQTFRNWAAQIFAAACEAFCLDCDKNAAELSASLKSDTLSPDTVRFVPCSAPDEELTALSKMHNRKVTFYSLKERVNLHSNGAERVTNKIVLVQEEEKAALSYQCGDHVGIMASNRSELVDVILERLVNKPTSDDEPVQLQQLHEKHSPMGVQKQWLPHEKLPIMSLRGLFIKYLDITTPPRPNVLLYLARCTKDDGEKKQLTCLAKFPSVKPDATVLCTMLPFLQPRFYSVSSSPLVHPSQLHLTIAVVIYATERGDGPTHYGVCSNYLNDVPPNSKIPCFVRSAPSFHLPNDDTRPVIMVGPGTGIAPFRGFWQQRHSSATNETTISGKMALFFGCRTKEMILYRSELEKMKSEGILADIFLALSREPGVKKTYVQDLLRRQSEKIAQEILKEGGHVYVCGDCTMAEEVYHTLKSILETEAKFNETEAENYMMSLRDDNRYHEDIFGITHRTAEVHEKVRQTAMTKIESSQSLSGGL